MSCIDMALLCSVRDFLRFFQKISWILGQRHRAITGIAAPIADTIANMRK